MATQVSFQKPGEKWAELGAYAVAALTEPPAADEGFDAETIFSKVGAKFDKIILNGAVTAAQDGANYLEVVTSNTPIATAADFTAAPNKVVVQNCDWDGTAELPNYAEKELTPGRYLYIRRALTISGTGIDTTRDVSGTLQARLATKAVGASNRVSN